MENYYFDLSRLPEKFNNDAVKKFMEQHKFHVYEPSNAPKNKHIGSGAWHDDVIAFLEENAPVEATSQVDAKADIFDLNLGDEIINKVVNETKIVGELIIKLVLSDKPELLYLEKDTASQHSISLDREKLVNFEATVREGLEGFFGYFPALRPLDSSLNSAHSFTEGSDVFVNTMPTFTVEPKKKKAAKKVAEAPNPTDNNGVA